MPVGALQVGSGSSNPLFSAWPVGPVPADPSAWLPLLLRSARTPALRPPFPPGLPGRPGSPIPPYALSGPLVGRPGVGSGGVGSPALTDPFASLVEPFPTPAPFTRPIPTFPASTPTLSTTKTTGGGSTDLLTPALTGVGALGVADKLGLIPGGGLSAVGPAVMNLLRPETDVLLAPSASDVGLAAEEAGGGGSIVLSPGAPGDAAGIDLGTSLVQSAENAVPQAAELIGPLALSSTEPGAFAGSASAAQGVIGPALETGLGVGGAIAAGVGASFPAILQLISLLKETRPTAQHFHTQEVQASQQNLAERLRHATSPAEIARAFNAVTGAGASGPDFFNPVTLSNLLSGTVFQDLGGSQTNLAKIALAEALQRAAPGIDLTTTFSPDIIKDASPVTVNGLTYDIMAARYGRDFADNAWRNAGFMPGQQRPAIYVEGVRVGDMADLAMQRGAPVWGRGVVAWPSGEIEWTDQGPPGGADLGRSADSLLREGAAQAGMSLEDYRNWFTSPEQMMVNL